MSEKSIVESPPLSKERIDAFLAKQEKRYPARIEHERKADEESAHEPEGGEVALTWSSEGVVTILARKDARFKWEEIGSQEPGTYFTRFPRGSYRDFTVTSKADVKVQWRT